jgi:hypothetical protein
MSRHRNQPLPSATQQSERLVKLLKVTGVDDVVVIRGSSGSGKTWLVNKAINTLNARPSVMKKMLSETAEADRADMKARQKRLYLEQPKNNKKAKKRKTDSKKPKSTQLRLDSMFSSSFNKQGVFREGTAMMLPPPAAAQHMSRDASSSSQSTMTSMTSSVVKKKVKRYHRTVFPHVIDAGDLVTAEQFLEFTGKITSTNILKRKTRDVYIVDNFSSKISPLLQSFLMKKRESPHHALIVIMGDDREYLCNYAHVTMLDLPKPNFDVKMDILRKLEGLEGLSHGDLRVVCNSSMDLHQLMLTVADIRGCHTETTESIQRRKHIANRASEMDIDDSKGSLFLATSNIRRHKSRDLAYVSKTMEKYGSEPVRSIIHGSLLTGVPNRSAYIDGLSMAIDHLTDIDAYRGLDPAAAVVSAMRCVTVPGAGKQKGYEDKKQTSDTNVARRLNNLAMKTASVHAGHLLSASASLDVLGGRHLINKLTAKQTGEPHLTTFKPIDDIDGSLDDKQLSRVNIMASRALHSFSFRSSCFPRKFSA